MTMRWVYIGAALLFAMTLIALRPAAHYGSVRSQTFPLPKIPATTGLCDETLWNHVYAGDPRKFSQPQDRLQVIQNCATVTGVIESATAEADGDWHVRLKLDHAYAQMINAKNVSGQHGDLVLEPICSNKITQKDTLTEHACDGFTQAVFAKNMVGKHVQVVGAYVTDMEHGWRELHPVTSITPLN